MTSLSKIILSEFQVRKSAAQKKQFFELIKSRYPQARIEAGGIVKSRNIIIGDFESAEVVFSAHYDTCAEMLMPNVLFPKNLLFSLLYGFLTAVPILTVSGALSIGALKLGSTPLAAYWCFMAALIALIALMYFGPANKHTANDNTSGVITLIELMEVLEEESLKKAAFVFFDNEEKGILGSGQFRKKHGKEMKDKLLINFDCVSDGEHIMLVMNRSARKRWGESLSAAFSEVRERNITIQKSGSVFYPSDQTGFKNSVAVAAFKKKKLLGYYINRIHTRRDTVLDEKNIEVLTAGMKKLMDLYI